MALSPEERSQIRQEEEHRLEVEEERMRVRIELADKKKPQSNGLGCLCVLIVSGAIILWSRYLATIGGTSGGAAPAPTTPAPPRSTVVGAGEEGHLKSGAPEVFLATDADSMSTLTDAAGAKDKYGFADLLLSGRVFSVPEGTRVLVLDPGFLKTRVRILEGENVGKSGFVPAEWVAR